jgi:hypothetical protein
MKRFLFVALLLAFVALPFFAHANDSMDAIFKGGYWGKPLLSCTGTACGLCDAVDTTANLLAFAFTILLYVILPAMILAGGFLIMISRGSEQYSQGRTMITSALIGTLIALLAYMVVSFVFDTIKPVYTGKGGGEIKWYQLNCQDVLKDLPYLQQPK